MPTTDYIPLRKGPRNPRPAIIPVGPSIAYLVLTRDQFALIDSDEASRASKLNWSAKWEPKSKHFYAVTNIPNENDSGFHMESLHVFIKGKRVGYTVDHKKPGDGLDCRGTNLRHVTNSQQIRNRRLPKNNTSGHRGVYLWKPNGKWVVKIHANGKLVHLGYFSTKSAAIAAYRKAAFEYYGAAFAGIRLDS